MVIRLTNTKMFPVMSRQQAQKTAEKTADRRPPLKDGFMAMTGADLSRLLRERRDLADVTIDIACTESKKTRRWWTDELTKSLPVIADRQEQARQTFVANPELLNILKTLGENRNFLTINLYDYLE